MPRPKPYLRRAGVLAAAVTIALANSAAAIELRGDALAARIVDGLGAALAAEAMVLESIDPGRARLELPDGARVSAVRLKRKVSSLAALDLEITLSDRATGEVLSRRHLRVGATASVPVLVTIRALAPGDVLRGKVRLLHASLDGPVSGLLVADADALATRSVARRRLGRGRMLRTSDLRPSPDVTDGERVLVTSADGRLTVGGTALAAGRTGQSVPVRVLAAGRPVTAMVIGPGRVELLPTPNQRRR